MVVGIGPGGVVSEYKCQPGSIVAISLPSVFPPGATFSGTTSSFHFTGSARLSGSWAGMNWTANGSKESAMNAGLTAFFTIPNAGLIG